MNLGYGVVPFVTVKITNCMKCDNCKRKLTKGYGYATDFFCAAQGNRIIARYCEWSEEEPQDGQIPEWCPLNKQTDHAPEYKIKDRIETGRGIFEIKSEIK